MTAPTKPTPGRTVRTALVLGGGSDIALATVARLAQRGLEHVVLAAREPDDAAATARGLAPSLQIEPVAWDATQTDSHPRLVAMAQETLGQIDLVLCAVGQLGHHAGLGMSPEDIVSMVAANFAGPASALAAVSDALVSQGRGTIVVLSSVAAVRPRKSNYVYGSSKAGLDAFAQGLGDALVDKGVEVLVVRPGFVTSKMTEGLDPAPFATRPEVVADAIADAIERGRSGVVSVPSKLGPMFLVLRNTPRPLWRRIAGDR